MEENLEYSLDSELTLQRITETSTPLPRPHPNKKKLKPNSLGCFETAEQQLRALLLIASAVRSRPPAPRARAIGTRTVPTRGQQLAFAGIRSKGKVH